MTTLEIQKKIMIIVEYFDTFCRINNIKYYLMGGSALGAIRHKGFIPWDDDFDVFMEYEDYHKFLSLSKKFFDRNLFHIQYENTEEWPLFTTKIRLNNTIFDEIDTKDLKIHRGIFIDVFCLYKQSNSKFLSLKQYFFSKILIAHSLYRRGYKSASLTKKILMFLTNLFISKNVKHYLINYLVKFNKLNTRNVAHYFGKAPGSKIGFPKAWLGLQRYVQFGELVLPTLQFVEEYLQFRFGDYMVIPSDKKIKEDKHV
jgi:lipopolysaccharide cholinephosphotransferase